MTNEPKLFLLDLVRRVEDSPLASIQGTMTGVLDLISNPDSNIKDLKDLIQIDPPLVAKVLKVANSSYYAPKKPISDIDQAIIWIGFDALKEIVLTQKACELFSSKFLIKGFSAAGLWRHSLALALLVKNIYRREFGEKGHNAYAAGLIHDIGIIIETQLLHDDFSKVVESLSQGDESMHQAEKKLWGVDHSDVGMAITSYWNFPLELIEAVGHHHRPDKAAADHRLLCKSIFIANQLVKDNGFSCLSPQPSVGEDISPYTRELGLTDYAVKALVSQMKEDLNQIEAIGVFQS